MAANQRERLLAAITDLTHERGYWATTVADVLARAAVSRASFYQLFDNREHCMLAAYDTHVTRVHGDTLSAYRTPALTGRDRLHAALERIFQHVVSWPAAARLSTSEISAVGTAGLKRREQTATVCARALASAMREIVDRLVSLTVTRAIVGGISRVIYTRVRDERERELPGMTEELIDWMLTYDSEVSGETEEACGEEAPVIRTQSVPFTLTNIPTPEGTLGRGVPRERILAAIADLAREGGYQAMTYRDIATTAQVSLTTFYKNFASKQEAFLAVFDVVCEHLRQIVDGARHAAPDSTRAVHDSLIAVLDAFARDPDAARLAMLEVLLTGRPGRERSDEVLRQVEEGLKSRLAATMGRPITYELVTGAISDMLCDYAINDRLAQLPALGPELSYIALAPFVGAGAARELTRLGQPRSTRS